ncbi:hypothetical protein PLICRDRAFT_147946 [Plicaturopsis crispa FD-325 SS-3]|uniref:XPG-I domain-containing protein n=1 Tax=Plicaturopsis crispa FD-325 SS-3 TaxID=944288 RepID=A0A0C9T6V8_PLICR|nr:hypothetical protein PLICRDRAFT_147946 [Plicaturopsis crispa FD-325 SS-3]
MGVPGLWDIIRSTGEVRSLTHLAVVDGFQANPGGRRGYRIGIDASIWFFHAAHGKEGENPELRTLFFRCARLMNTPFLPLFVFDGPKRPGFKRGKRVSGESHWLTTGMKSIIEAFGFEWRTAPGEAEAELAYLNRIGVIDAVLSDDVDNFLFGARVVVRNPSNTLSGNKSHPTKNSAGRDDGQHVKIFRAATIEAEQSIALTRGGFILIGLLSGGDYHTAGLTRCGPTIAHGLAKCGFGDVLYQAALELTREQLVTFLSGWRERLREELRTNSQGNMGKKSPALAKAVPSDFPDIDVLLSYVNPITSETEAARKGRPAPIHVTWSKEPDLGGIAQQCEQYFEWGFKERIIKRFRTVLWPSAVLRILRRAALDMDVRSGAIPPLTPRKNGKEHRMPVGTPSKMIAKHFSSRRAGVSDSEEGEEEDEEKRLIVKIHSKREHASTDGILEYRLEIAPAQLVRLAEAGVLGTRRAISDAEDSDSEDDGEDSDGEGKKKGKKKPPVDPNSHVRIWMPACMVAMVEPGLVQEYEDLAQKRLDKKAGKGRASPKKRAAKKSAGAEGMSEEEEEVPKAKPRATRKPAAKKAPVVVPQSEDEDTDTMAGVRKDLSTFFAASKSGAAARKPVKGAGFATTSQPNPASKPRRKPSPIPFPDDDAPSSSRVLSLLSGISQPSKGKGKSTVASISGSQHDADYGEPPRGSQPKPFPMSFDDFMFNPNPQEDEDMDAFAGPSKAAPVPVNMPRRRKSHSSGSDSRTDGITKSPRKAVEQTSPRSKRVAKARELYQEVEEDSESDTGGCRPASPSPFRPRVGSSRLAPAKPNPNTSVIEISSDSDAPAAPPSRPKLQPLLAARSKMNARSNTEPLANAAKPHRSKLKPALSASDQNRDMDIIDLT